MPSKNYVYNVRIKASLDSTSLRGAGSSVSKDLDEGLRQSKQSDEKRATQAKASLDKVQAVETDLYKGRIARQKKFDKDLADENNRLFTQLEKDAKASANRRFAIFEQLESKLDKLHGRGAASGKFNRAHAAGKYAGFSDDGINKLRAGYAKIDAMSSQAGSGVGRSFWGSFRGAFIGILTGMAIGGVLQVAAGVGQQVVAAIQKGMELQQLKIGLAAVSTTAAAAAERVAFLEYTSQNTPGLAFQSAVEGQMRLQAVGFRAKEATEMLVGLSKVRMLSNSTEEDYRAVILNLSQIKSMGKLTGDEIRETLGRMPAMASVFRSAFGTVDIKQIRDMGLTGYEFFQKFTEALKDVPQRAETTSSSLIKLQNSWLLAQEAMAEGTLDPLKDFFLKLSVVIDENREVFRSWGVELGQTIKTLTGFVNGPTFFAMMQMLAQPFRAVTGAANPFGLGPGTALAFPGLAVAGAIANPFVQGAADSKAYVKGINNARERAANGGVLSDKTVEEQLAEAKDLNEKLNVLLSDADDRRQKSLNDLEAGLRQRSLLSEVFGVKSMTVERDRLDETRKITEEFYQYQIDAAIRHGLDTEQIVKQRNNWRITEERSTAAEMLAIWKNERDLKDQAELDQYTLSNPVLGSGDRSTLGGQRAGSATDFNTRLGNINLRREQWTTRFNELAGKLPGGGYSGGYLGPEKTRDLVELEGKYKAGLDKLDIETRELTAARADSKREESRALKEALLRGIGGRLTLSTNYDDMDSIIKSIAGRYKVNPNFLSAFTNYETRDRSDGTNNKSMARRNAATSMENTRGRGTAKGAFQQLDSFAQQFGVRDQRNFSEAAGGTARWLQQAIEYYKDQPDAVELIASAYNGGTGLPRGARAKAKQIARLRRLSRTDGQNTDYTNKVAGLIRQGVNAGSDVSFGDVDVVTMAREKLARRDEDDVLDRMAGMKKSGIIPKDEEIEAYYRIQSERQLQQWIIPPRKRDFVRDEFQPGAMQLTDGLRSDGWTEDLVDRYNAQRRAAQRAPWTMREGQIGQRIAQDERLTGLDTENGIILDRNSRQDARIAFGERRNANNTSAKDYDARFIGFNGEIGQAKEKQRIARKNEMLDLKVEYEVIKDISAAELNRLNQQKAKNALAQLTLDTEARVLGIAKEITNTTQTKKLEQTNQILDAERDIAVLTAQSADSQFVFDRRRLAALNERLQLEREFFEMEDQMANSGVNDALVIRNGLMRQQLDIQNEQRDAILEIKKAEVDINRSLEIRGTTIFAKIMGHLAQQKTLNEALADDFIDIYEKAAGGLDGLIDKMTGKIGGLFSNTLKVGARSILTNVSRSIMDQFGLGGVFDKVNESSNPVVAGLQKQDRQIDLLEQIAKNTGGGLGGFIGGSSGGGGNPFSSFIRALGGGGMGPGGTPMFNPSGVGGGGNSILSAIFGGGGGGGSIFSQIPGTTGSISNGAYVVNGSQRGGLGGIWGSLKGLFSKNAGGFASMLPMLGLSLGSSLGGGSMLGSILGGVGGLGLGFSAFAATTAGAGMLAGLGGIAPFIGALMTNPFTIAAAAALLPLAIILSRNAKRRKEEQQRTVMMNSASAELDKLISAVKGRRMSGSDALAQAEQIRTQYNEQASQLKDKKTRNIALAMWNPEHPLGHRMGLLKQAAEVSGAADEREKRILPEFAHGGLVGGVLDLTNFRRRNGRVAGNRYAGDVVPSLLTAEEMVINRAQQDRIQNIAGSDVFRQAQIPGYGGSPTGAQQAPVAMVSGGSSDTPIMIYVSQELDANNMVQLAIKTEGVKREQVKVIKQMKKDGDL